MQFYRKCGVLQFETHFLCYKTQFVLRNRYFLSEPVVQLVFKVFKNYTNNLTTHSLVHVSASSDMDVVLKKKTMTWLFAQVKKKSPFFPDVYCQ